MSLIERLHVSTNQVSIVPIVHFFQQIVDAAPFRLALHLTRRRLFPYLPDCFIASPLSPETFDRLNMAHLDHGHDVREPIENVGILMIFESLSLIGVFVDDKFEDT